VIPVVLLLLMVFKSVSSLLEYHALVERPTYSLECPLLMIGFKNILLNRIKQDISYTHIII